MHLKLLSNLNKTKKVLLLCLLCVVISGVGVLWQQYSEKTDSRPTIVESQELRTHENYYSESEKVDSETSVEAASAEGLININTATAEQLQTLSGIGETYSRRIIEYRIKNGEFKTIQDIMKVTGVGRKRFESIKDYICVK